MGATSELASWVTECQFMDLPPEVVHEAKRSIINFLAVTIAGAHHTTLDRALAVAQALGGAKKCTVLGRPCRTDAAHAALLNGIASHVLDFDDTHMPTIIHPAGPILPPVLALAEWRGGSGRDVLLAFVVGVEVGCRAGLAVFPDHYDIGWHITGTAGTIGAAASAARFLRLNNEQTTYALGLGATQASGLREMFGSMGKSFHVGRAAQSGLLAALLAEQGFTSSTRALEAPRGWCHVSSPSAKIGELTAQLGTRWEMCRNTYKPFACGVVTHPAIDGVLRIRRRQHIDLDQVATIQVQAHRLVRELCGNPAPTTGLEGKFSIFHCCAVALIDGGAGEAQFTEERVRDPSVVRIRQRVSLVTVPELRPDEAVVRIELVDGTWIEEHVEHAVGTLEHPLSDNDLEVKFRELVAPVLGTPAADLILESIWRLEHNNSPEELIMHCSAP